MCVGQHVDNSLHNGVFATEMMLRTHRITRTNSIVWFNPAPMPSFGVICVSQQRIRPYLVFVASEPSILVRKANDLLRTTRKTSQ